MRTDEEEGKERMIIGSFARILFGISLFMGVSHASDSTLAASNSPVDAKDNISILVGYNGIVNHFVEIGLARNKFGRYGHHPNGTASYFASEISPDGSVIGGKIGKWYSAMGWTVAGNALAYFERGNINVGIRPEIGIGMGNFKIAYGLNLLAPDFFSRKYNMHVLNISIAFGVYTIRKINSWDENER